jgi:hypothetical protein
MVGWTVGSWNLFVWGWVGVRSMGYLFLLRVGYEGCHELVLYYLFDAPRETGSHHMPHAYL